VLSRCKEEVDHTMAGCGCADIADIGPWLACSALSADKGA
jgi:hypothetical protein